MRASLFIALVAFSALCCSAWAASNGFNDKIDWLNDLEAGLSKARSEHKPLLFLVFSPECGACVSLKANFEAAGDDFVQLSKQFVMVNVDADDDSANQPSVTLDGGYIPRVYFFTNANANANGQVDPDHALINAKGLPQYKYYYSTLGALSESMQAALRKIASPNVESELEAKEL